MVSIQRVGLSVFVSIAWLVSWPMEVSAQQTRAPENGNLLQPGPADQLPIKLQAPRTAPRAPFQLTQEERVRLDKILTFWELKSGKIKTFSTQFDRWEYNPVFGPKNPNIPISHSQGIIRYAAPDKGEFHVQLNAPFQPPDKPGDRPVFNLKPVENGEHWVCTGSVVYELNHKTKQLVETHLPPQMQGKRIADGPLPFMFGAEKEKMLTRYWIREIIPPNGQLGEYWLEAIPKLRADAANFQRVVVVLDEKKFLALAIQVYPPNFDPQRNPARTSYRFSQRKVDDPIHRTKDFFDQFISPRVPVGWKKIVENVGGAGPAERPVTAANAKAKQARLPRLETKR